MTQDNLNLIYRHHPNIVSRSIAGDMVLVPIRKNIADMESIYTLNGTAARIWELVDGINTLDTIHNKIYEEFDIQSEEAKTDLLELIDQLVMLAALEKVE